MRPEFLAALEFAQGADQVDDPEELRRRFGQVVEQFGVRYFASVVTAAPGQVLRPRFLFGEVDPAWSRHYERQGYAAVDPSVAALFETRTPFTWREALARRRSPAGERLLDEIAERTGADAGLLVPVHDGGETGAVILSGRGAEFGPDVRPVLHLASVYFNSIGRDLVEGGPGEPECPLTERQLECLRWAMDGKSDWEIGEILGISERTAHNHIEAAKRLLDVGTRVQAVVQACRRGWLV